MSHLEQLQEAVRALVKTNIDGQDFVPYSWLVDLFTREEENIVLVLDGGAIEDYERRFMAKRVLKGGVVTFATLVMMGQPDLIRRFFDRDAGVAGGTDPDRDLPFKRSWLDENLTDYAQPFWETQYMFHVPTFPQGMPHRIHDAEIRLPFVKLDHGPALGKKRAPKGNFGVVTSVKIPPVKRNDADTKNLHMVWKRLKSRGHQAYKDEVRCLRLLGSAQHESILELRGSFTKGGVHSFLFPEAESGDLHSFVAGRRPDALADDEAVYLAACGLASALEHLHCFSSDDMNLELLGCHHDLKPKNVLVDGARFILADFGLSRITDSAEELEDGDTDRDPNFEAPERRDYTDESHRKRAVGRPADIWSLGCILAVILAYMKGGSAEVKNFSEQREWTTSLPNSTVDITTRAFHKWGERHDGVLDWLAGRGWLQESSAVITAADEGLVELIKEMLSIDPSCRPDITKVLRRLRWITLKKAAEPIQAQLEAADGGVDGKAPHQPMRLEYAVERQVFLEWLDRIDGASQAPVRGFLSSDAVFAQIHGTVRAIRDEFKMLADAARDDTPLYAQLRRLNGQLLGWLDPADQSSVRTIAELKVMPTAREIFRASEDPTNATESLLPSTPRPRGGELRPDENVKVLLCAANVAKLMAKSQSAVPKLDPAKVTLLSRTEVERPWRDDGDDGDDDKSSQEEDEGEADSEEDEAAEEETVDQEEKESREVRSFGLGNLAEDGLETPVVIESLEIVNADYSADEMSSRLFASLEMVLSLPPEQASRFGALNCAGIYLDTKQKRIRLLYRYPDVAGGVGVGVGAGAGAGTDVGHRSPRVRHLAEILGMFSGPVDYNLGLFVSVDERLRLARDLAAAVFEFHKIRWWHKSISSYNVLLFFYDDVLPARGSHARRAGTNNILRKLALGRPYLIGFSHSRPGNADYSNKIHGQSALVPYRHPKYAGADAADATTAAGYLAEYDYYSLGLVLLEIGLWCRLRRFATDRSQTREDMRKELLRDWVPVLEGTLGAAYASAVESCLSGVLSGSGTNPDQVSVDENFERLVLRPLKGGQSDVSTS